MPVDCSKSTFCQRRTDPILPPIYLSLSFMYTYTTRTLTNHSFLKQIHKRYPAAKLTVSSSLKPIMHVNAFPFQPTDSSTSTTQAQEDTAKAKKQGAILCLWEQTCWAFYSKQGGCIKETEPRRWKTHHRGPAYTVCPPPVCLSVSCLIDYSQLKRPQLFVSPLLCVIRRPPAN